MSPRISIIVPVFNTSKYLHACLSSILGQKYRDFEVLIIDDGSTDGSSAICDEYASNDDRIKVFHKENGGVSSARNLGLDHAKGEWVYFVDSDDEVLPGGLQTMIDYVNDDLDIIQAGYKKVNENDLPVLPIPSFESVALDRITSIKTLYHKYSLFYPYNGYLWQRLFRMSVIKNANIRFDIYLRIKEDTLFITQYICHSKGNTLFVDTPVYKYYMRSNCAMSGWRLGFDYKYLDSFDALVRMKNQIKTAFPSNRELAFVANEGIWSRYRLIIERIEREGINDNTIKRRLLRKTMREVSIRFFVTKLCRRVNRFFIYHQ